MTDYFPNGNVFFSNDYNLEKIKTNLLISDLKEIKFCMNDIKKADKSTITKAKIKDLMSLLPYLNSDNRKFYVNYFSQFNCNSEDLEIICDESDLEY